MKNVQIKLCLGVCLLFLFVIQAKAQTLSPNRIKIGQLLMELEANMTWNSVDKDWEKERERWINQCSGAYKWMLNEPISAALIELATHTQAEALQQPKWQSQYSFWVKSCEEANLDFDEALVKQLLIFEEHLLWDYVSKEWASRREAWIAECKSIKNSSEPTNPNAEEEAMEFLKK